MLAVVSLAAALLPSVAVALGQDQLYTGTAVTTPPGKLQYQIYYNTTFSGGARLGGTSFTYGASRSADVRVGYSYLWNYRGPDVQLGPNLALKWRFMGNGSTNPSASVSCMYALNEGLANQTRRNDVGGLLILQYPTRWCTLLGNLGRVWVGGENPDARFVAFAAGRMVTRRVLVAGQYVELASLGGGPRSRDVTNYVLGVVYIPSERLSYGLQIGYVPQARFSHWNATLGFSDTF